jgi:methyltransferase (TIGR00027 family)
MTLTVADTAYSIAAVRADETELFEDPYAKHFVAAGAHAEEGTRRYLDLPFFRDGIRLRTRFIDDALRDAMRDGFDQVVLLGTGFDARGLRMRELEHARVFEIDSREQLARKREILESAGVRIPERVTYVPVDFDKDDLAATLRSAGARDDNAVFVWEGVIGYIDMTAIDASLRFMANAARRSRVVFTFGEGSFAPEGTAAHVAKLGYSKCEELGLDAVWPRYLRGPAHPSSSYSKVGVIESLRSETHIGM